MVLDQEIIDWYIELEKGDLNRNITMFLHFSRREITTSARHCPKILKHLIITPQLSFFPFQSNAFVRNL